MTCQISVCWSRPQLSQVHPKRYVFFSLLVSIATCILTSFFHALDQDGVPSTPVKCESPEELPSSIWPSETDLVYTSGSNKLRLTIQHTYVKAVIHDAVENIKASIMFDDAFPNANVCITFATEALTLAAKGRLPSSRDILARLTDDSQYLAKIIPLVCIYNI